MNPQPIRMPRKICQTDFQWKSRRLAATDFTFHCNTILAGERAKPLIASDLKLTNEFCEVTVSSADRHHRHPSAQPPREPTLSSNSCYRLQGPAYDGTTNYTMMKADTITVTHNSSMLSEITSRESSD